MLQFEMGHNLLNHVAEFAVDSHRIVTMNFSNEIGALADVSTVLLAPLHPPVVTITDLQSWTSSMARATYRRGFSTVTPSGGNTISSDAGRPWAEMSSATRPGPLPTLPPA